MPLVTDGFIDDTDTISDVPLLFWHNLVTINNITTDSQDPDFPVTNLANPSLSLKWKQDFTDSPLAQPDTITVRTDDLGPINYIAIAGHNFGSTGSTIAVEGTSEPSGSSPDLSSPAEGEWITGFIPSDDSPLILMFGEVETEVVRLRFVNPSSTPLEIAVMYVGKATVMEEGIQADHTPLPLAITRDRVAGQSENATFLGAVITGEWMQSTASFANMSADWTREELVPFLEFASENPFFWAWQPESYPDEVAFAWMTESPQPVLDIDGYFAIDLPMRGLVE